jgi:hypothetical protein
MYVPSSQTYTYTSTSRFQSESASLFRHATPPSPYVTIWFSWDIFVVVACAVTFREYHLCIGRERCRPVQSALTQDDNLFPTYIANHNCNKQEINSQWHSWNAWSQSVQCHVASNFPIKYTHQDMQSTCSLRVYATWSVTKREEFENMQGVFWDVALCGSCWNGHVGETHDPC